MKHTPGPWKFGNTSDDKKIILGGTSERYVCSVQIWQTPRRMGLTDEPERDANAHLIASAPELLEACKGMLKIYYDTNVSYRHEHEKRIAYQCEQAIAKAEGK